MTRFRTLSLAGLLGLSTLVGCSSSDNDRSSRRDRDDVSRTAGGNVERESGATSRVPRDARVVDEGRGGTLDFVARDSGTVYLVDETAGVVVWDSRVRDGDRVTVTPGRNRIEINGRETANIDLKKNDRFQLYFLRR